MPLPRLPFASLSMSTILLVVLGPQFPGLPLTLCHGFAPKQPPLRIPATLSLLRPSLPRPPPPRSSAPGSIALSLVGKDAGEDGSGAEPDSGLSLSTPLDRPLLAAVDLASLIGFAAVGKASHNPDGSFDIGAVLFTALPFLAAWYATSPLTGVYGEDERGGNVVSEAFLKAGKGWVIAVPLGIALRGLIKGYVPPTPFIIVTLISTLVILGGSRTVFALVEDFFVEFV